jgi:hypothetical protein
MMEGAEGSKSIATIVPYAILFTEQQLRNSHAEDRGKASTKVTRM